VLHVEVARPDRGQADAVAKAVVARFAERLTTLATDGTTQVQPVSAVSLRAPVAEQEANNSMRTLFIALIIGFGFSTLVAFTLDRS